ncbi:AraC family transcriptional regulator [Roseomonas sp. 18066]|uniref:AraC family transcriptional regulator n=1 Tax=Roseomonas sp. 18066 TaxID=2681412 RepID=UPI001356E360|nr:AraC family transcriptional regulator [Roseomonas sp. 18066]
MVISLQQDGWAVATVATPGYVTGWHVHDCAMLLLPRQGAMLFELEGQRAAARMRPGEALLVAPGIGHRTRAAEAAHRHLVLYAPAARLRHWLPARHGWHLALLPAGMLTLLRYRDALQEGTARALLTERLLLEEAVETRPEPAAVEHGAALARAVASHLAAHPQEAHPLDGLAARFGLSRRQLTRLFRRHLGTSIADHLAALRVEAAARRIAAGQSVLAAAQGVGLASPSHLARLFRRHRGHCPSQARSAP